MFQLSKGVSAFLFIKLFIICMRPPYRKSLVVYSDNQSLPMGFDIITACQLSKSKAGHRCPWQGFIPGWASLFKTKINLFIWGTIIVTCDCVPSAILKKWRPSATRNRPSEQDNGFDDDKDDGSLDDADNTEFFSPLASGPVLLPSTQPALAVGHHHNGSENEEVISISGKKIDLYSKNQLVKLLSFNY